MATDAGRLGDSLTEFIRHYLMKKGEFVRTDSIYFELKEHLGQDDPLTLLQALSRAAVSYKKLLEPAYEPDRKIRLALERLGRLDVTTAYPFLLNCYEEYDRGMLSPTDFSEIIAHLENFIVRRFVCNVPTSQLNKIFAALYNQIQSGGHATLLEGVRRVLSTKGYPKDIDFKERLKGARLYGPGERLEKTRFILESIERSFGHKEKVDLDGLTIEHVMPQTLTDSWRVHLGDDWQANYELLLHTLGNLTLTGYNPELSNEDFAAKKKHLAQKSHVQMNQFFADCERWDANEIERRAEFLATAAIGIWPYFGGEQEEVIAVTAAPGKPKVLRFLNQEYPVKTWRDVLATTLKVIIERDPQAIEGLLSDFPTLLSRQKEKLRVTREFADGLFVYVDLSAKNVNLWCQRFLEAAEIDRDAWSVEIG